MLDSILDSLQVVSLPTKTSFRSVELREVALIEGPKGWGEFSPFLEYQPAECVSWLVSAVEAAVVPPPLALRYEIPVNATLPAVNGEEEIAKVLSWFPGCTTVKVKVGADLHEDLERIEGVTRLLPDAKIRVDVNGSWTIGKATQAIHAINDICDLEYVEQPCATLEDLRELKKRIGLSVLIAGDEVIRKSADPTTLELEDAIDIVMLKVAPLGGIAQALAIAQRYNKPVVVSSALDSAVGIYRGLQLAAALPTLQYACGLGTGALLAADVAEIKISDGKIKLEEVVPNRARIQEHLATPERTQWWRNRIEQTWDAGAKGVIQGRGWSW